MDIRSTGLVSCVINTVSYQKEVADVILTALVSGGISIISLKEVADVIRL
jgi:hypothetical protein